MAARIASLSRLPEQAWREVSSRARILGVKAEMLDDGARLHLEVDIPAAAAGAREPAAVTTAVVLVPSGSGAGEPRRAWVSEATPPDYRVIRD